MKRKKKDLIYGAESVNLEKNLVISGTKILTLHWFTSNLLAEKK